MRHPVACRADVQSENWRPQSLLVSSSLESGRRAFGRRACFIYRASPLPGSRAGVRALSALGSTQGGPGNEPYEVRSVTPPPRNLGMHLLPQNTQCGDLVSCLDQDFVVNGVVYRYRLTGGKYRRESKRLEVTGAGRSVLNAYLDNMLLAGGGNDGRDR